MNALGTARILMIEDEPGDVEFARLAFEEAGIDVELAVCSTGREAADHLAELAQLDGDSHPHLVLLDLNLPERPGQDLLRAIKRSRVLRDIPVVVLTTSSSPHDRRECLDLGAADFVVKPNRFRELVEVVRGLARFL